MKIVWMIVICVLLPTAFAVSGELARPQPETRFNEQILPILSEYCFACHGPDLATRQADLRLDDRGAALASGVIAPGNAQGSELVTRISSEDPDFKMPPPEFRKSLSPAQRRLLVNWIDDGASWEPHWSFITPRRSELPKPAGVDAWARNAIDHFVLEKIIELQLQPNQPADVHTLARRAALDIIGLPPDMEMLEAFVSDSDAHAYERYVDKLLMSRHAGEHRARYWLDAARYGDTHGMHVDNYREMWPYRDWVVDAFNSNMPFDRFVLEQIAGDLLPDPTIDQRIATGFNRCNITTSEGGAIPAELDVRYMVDRVETTTTVMLGLTAGCAVCHDHKYDPISQREFYQLGAFFNNTTQPAMDGNRKDTPPVVALPSAEFQDEWKGLQARRKKLRDELSRWDQPATDGKEGSDDTPRSEWWTSRPRDFVHPVATDDLILSLPLTEGEGNEIALPEFATWATGHPAGRRGVWFGKDGAISVDCPTLRSDQPFSISFWFRTPDRVMAITILDQTKANQDDKTVGWKIAGNTQGELNFSIFDGNGQKVTGHLPDNEALHPRVWQHVCVRYSGGQSNSSMSILVNGRKASLRDSTEARAEATELADTPLKIAGSLSTAGLSDIRIFRRWLSDQEVQLLAADHVLKKLLQSDAAWNQLKPQDQQLVTIFHKEVVDEGYQSRSRELSRTQRRRDYIYSRSTTTLVMQERPTEPRAWVLERGEYDQRRDQVAPGVPAVLDFLRPTHSRIPQDLDVGGADRQATNEFHYRNRLDLARWLIHSDHPLTARVMVNRLWQSVFGIGLVKTSEDFGVMGERPTHPELLDWLAVEFVESGWDVNHILKLMVTSAAYRQSSAVTPEKLHKDPQNRFLAHGPRLRLDAEVLRDQALAVSGLLKRKMGGVSVKPYQPAGLWKVVAITGSNTREFKRDSGDRLYRRSVYTFWKRTSPPPSMAAFNAPTREQCTVRRERTNTPIQALVLMNSPQFFEAARSLAENTMKRHDDDRSRLELLLRAVLSRPANEVDLTDMASAVGKFRDMFQQDPEAAKELISTGDSVPDKNLDGVELAAWTMVATTLMNRDDFLNK